MRSFYIMLFIVLTETIALVMFMGDARKILNWIKAAGKGGTIDIICGQTGVQKVSSSSTKETLLLKWL